MNKFFFLIMFLLYSSYCMGQFWEGIGEFSNGSVHSLYSDSTENILYIGGSFATIDSIEYNGVAFWDGEEIFPMGTGQDACSPWGCSSGVFTIAKYNNHILANSVYTPFDGIENGGVVQWDGNTWADFGTTFQVTNGIGIIRNIEEIDHELYLMGLFLNVDSIPMTGIVKWTGIEISDLNFPSPYSDPLSEITSVVIYNEELYVAGNIAAQNANNEYVHDVLKYNGTQWEKVGQGINGFGGHIADMVVYKEELYVAGLIYESEGNPGDGILKFDGNQWTDVGGSFHNNAQVLDLLVHDDELYAFGLFDNVGEGFPTNNIAKWNGERWCTFDYSIVGKIIVSEVHNDKIVIGGGFHTIDGEDIGDLVIATNELIPDFCEIVSTQDLNNNLLVSFIFPNPGKDILNINIENTLLKSNITFTISNFFGQTIHQEQLFSLNKKTEKQIEVSHLSNGTYFLTIQNGEKIVTRKFVISRQ